MSKKKEVIRQLKNTTPNKVVNIWNACCYNTKRYDDIITKNDIVTIAINYHFDTFDDLGEAMRGSNYKASDKFAFINGNGHLQTFTNILEDPSSPIDMDILADYIIKYEDEYGLIDKEKLFDTFINEYFSTYDKELIHDILNGYLGLDLLIEDWNELKDDVFDSLHETENK